MKTQLNKSDNLADNFRLASTAKTVRLESHELSTHPVLLVSRICFAVLVIGLMGYFFDRVVHPQKFDTIHKHREL